MIVFFYDSKIEHFRSLQDSDGFMLTHNYRPIQPIGDRVVWYISNDVVMNGNSISPDKRYDDQDEDVSSQLKKKPNNSGMQLESKVNLIFSLSTVTLLKMFLP